ncbi:MAG: hypothetical protein HW416_456 [Chloroflexi bacterium]|nr:hypothetical protein [Chloroflexota bacterium]
MTARPGLPRSPAPCVVYVDTNVLLDLPDLRDYRTSYPDVTLVILPEVLGELNGLSRVPGQNGQAARRSMLALHRVEHTPGVAVGVPVPGGTVSVMVPERHGVKGLSVDDALLRAAQTLQRREARSVVGLFTRDGRIAERALFSGIPCPLPRKGPITAPIAEAALKQLVAAISSY